MSEEDLIDEEILEIFVEEAEEVLETINEFFPQWRADTDNDEARTTVRRSFHTLKGSGRMVQAYEIGELAWSIENMLNRILDGTIEPNDNIFDLIQQVVDLIPGMVKSFEERTPITVNVQPLMSAADAFAKGQQPAPVTVETAAPAEPEAPAAAVTEGDDMDAEFKQDVTRKLDELAKTVQQLSMAVKGLNSELPNVKTKIRELEARPANAAAPGANPEITKDLFAAKTEITKLQDLVESESSKSQRLFDEIKSYNSSVNKELESQRKKAATLSQELTSGIDKLRAETSSLGGAIKGWAIGAGIAGAVIAIAVSKVL